MSLLDDSNSVRPIGGLSIGPREDYNPPVPYRRNTGTVTLMEPVAMSQSKKPKPASSGKAPTVINIGMKTQAGRIMDAVRSGARTTSEIVERSGVSRVDTIKRISALVKKEMLWDLLRPPSGDRCVMPVESPQPEQSQQADCYSPVASPAEDKKCLQVNAGCLKPLPAEQPCREQPVPVRVVPRAPRVFGTPRRVEIFC
ncbi:hypothetical protein HAP94_20140 [Acidithiobacillus ferrivorans]|nr:hypothetical protein [Acidithiobacillus ferrivorans]